MTFIIPDAARPRHVYIAGKSQSGKSTLIFWMALQDIRQGKGVCLLDPHGDLVNKLIHHIPKSRVEDTIHIDATSPVPLNFMHCESDHERDVLADDLYVLFQRFTDTSGERMNAILRHLIPTLLSVSNTTFLDIHYFLAHDNHRKTILSKLKNPDLLQYWNNIYPHLPKDAASPILSRMSKFLLTPALKTILGTANAKLDLFSVMQNKQILLVNLAKVGQESGAMLGTLLVSKLQQAAMRRQYQKPSERVPFYLYADEFQHFQTSAFDVILSEAGKYKLCLTLAHQYVDQLDSKIRASIFGNVSTFILLRLNEKDASLFKGELGQDEQEEPYWQHLLHLPTGKALYRAPNGKTHEIKTPAPPPHSLASYAEIIRKRTLDLYGLHTTEEPVESKVDDEVRPSGRPKNVPPNET